MTDEERRLSQQDMLRQIEENEAEEKERKKHQTTILFFVGIILLLVISGGILFSHRHVEPEVYYMEDGRTIDYRRMVGKLQSSGLYDQVYSFRNDYAVVEKKGKMGIVNGHGTLIVPIKYDYCDYFDTFYPNMAKVQLNEKFGLVGKDGKEIVPPIYDEIGTFTDGVAPVVKSGRKLYINKHGQEVHIVQ